MADSKSGRRGGGRTASVLAVLLVAGAAVSSCGASGGPVAVGPGQNGQTVTVTTGQRVDVTLAGATWRFDLTPAFGPLTELSLRLSSGRTSTATAVFRTDRTGSATVKATRPPCQGRPCPGGDTFVVHVVVQK